MHRGCNWLFWLTSVAGILSAVSRAKRGFYGPRPGPKAFEQAAGFLRIRDAENPLDSSAVHPESYAIVG